MTRQTTNPKATQPAVARVGQIADAQRRIAELLKAAATQVRQLEAAVTRHARHVALALQAEQADAAAIARALAEHRVRTGDLPSALVDALERRGQRIYPTPYQPIASPWALVETHS